MAEVTSPSVISFNMLSYVLCTLYSIAIKYGSLPAIKYGGYAYSTSTTIFAADEYIVEVQGKSGTLMDQVINSIDDHIHSLLIFVIQNNFYSS